MRRRSDSVPLHPQGQPSQILGVHVTHIQCLSARPSLLPRLQKQQGQRATVQGGRSELCKICCGCCHLHRAVCFLVLPEHAPCHSASISETPRFVLVCDYLHDTVSIGDIWSTVCTQKNCIWLLTTYNIRIPKEVNLFLSEKKPLSFSGITCSISE